MRKCSLKNMKRGSMHVDLTKTFFFFSMIHRTQTCNCNIWNIILNVPDFFLPRTVLRESNVLATLHMKLLGVEVRSFKVTLPQKTWHSSAPQEVVFFIFLNIDFVVLQL